MSEIKFILDDFEIKSLGTGSLSVLKMKLCEPVQVKSGEEISYFILIGPSHGIRGEFALDSTREKIDYFYQEITLDLFHPLSGEKFYNYEQVWNLFSEDNVWAWDIDPSTERISLGITTRNKPWNCLVLTAFYGSIESNDISKIISSSENKLCREKNYLVELLRKNPTEERELNEFLSKARAFERGTLGDESKRRIHERLSSEKLIKGRTIPEILDEWETRLLAIRSSKTKEGLVMTPIAVDDFGWIGRPDEETLDPWKSEEEIETQRDEEDSGSKEDYYSGEEDRKDPEPDTRPLDEEEASSENTEDTEDHETPPPPPKEENPLFDGRLIMLAIILMAIILFFLVIILVRKRRKINKSGRDRLGSRFPLDKKDI